MKKCTKCHKQKEEADYSRNGKMGRHTSCKQCQNDAKKKYREENKEVAKKRDRGSYIRNKDAKKKSIKKYYEAHSEEIKQNNRNRYSAKAEDIKEQTKVYRTANKDKVREWNGTRRANVKTATPKWADRVEIRRVYEEASRLWELTGIEHHVDHIIPLTNPKVCGLHVHNNLQVLTITENLSKSNRF